MNYQSLFSYRLSVMFRVSETSNPTGIAFGPEARFCATGLKVLFTINAVPDPLCSDEISRCTGLSFDRRA